MSYIEEKWFTDAMKIYEYEQMITQRLCFHDEIREYDIPTLDNIGDDLESIIDLEFVQINEVLHESETEAISQSRKTIRDCSKWIKKWKA
jgi:hypothetical protein